MKEPDSFAAVWDENSRSWICEEFNAWSWTGEPGTWKPRIGNPKAQEQQMARKKKRDGDMVVVTATMPVVDDVYPDQVLRPRHYLEGRKIEPWNAVADWQLDFFLGNAVKYISRAGRKGDAAEDIRKAITYLNKKLELLGAKP